jgi:hypothetical protein
MAVDIGSTCCAAEVPLLQQDLQVCLAHRAVPQLGLQEGIISSSRSNKASNTGSSCCTAEVAPLQQDLQVGLLCLCSAGSGR